jgi:hypothetical protein
MRERYHFPIRNEDDCATAVRDICGVDSRADLSKPGKTSERQRWFDIDCAFQAWKVREHG